MVVGVRSVSAGCVVGALARDALPAELGSVTLCSVLTVDDGAVVFLTPTETLFTTTMGSR